RLRDLASGRPVRDWAANGGVIAVRFAPDGRLLVCGRDGKASVWDGAGNRVLEIGHGVLATSCAVGQDKGLWLVGDDEGGVRGYDAAGASMLEFDASPETIAQRTLRIAVAEVARLVSDLDAMRPAHASLVATLDGATKEHEGAQAEVGRLETALQDLETYEAQVLGTFEAARARAEEARLAVSEANGRVSGVTDAHARTSTKARDATDRALEALDRGSDDLEGLIAIARLAMEEAASLALDLALATRDAARAEVAAQPLLEGEAVAQATLEKARAATTSMRATVDAARARLGEAGARFEAARDAVVTSEASIAATEGALEAARAEVVGAQAESEAQMQAIRAAGGRVGS
ncbi:MAG: hypothetical protein KDA28_00390, partial [Phycisphaerales bacterium]|nr:hypothetical protein [Phycisphaerales bacterium]